jgi:hypothetical protein
MNERLNCSASVHEPGPQGRERPRIVAHRPMSLPRVKVRTAGHQAILRKLGNLEKAMRAEKPVHLYWVTVPDDPSEDWFVFATQAHLSRAFFEDYEGFESREAEARLVKRDVRLNKFELGERPCWAQLSRSGSDWIRNLKPHSEFQIRPQGRRNLRRRLSTIRDCADPRQSIRGKG